MTTSEASPRVDELLRDFSAASPDEQSERYRHLALENDRLRRSMRAIAECHGPISSLCEVYMRKTIDGTMSLGLVACRGDGNEEGLMAALRDQLLALARAMTDVECEVDGDPVRQGVSG